MDKFRIPKIPISVNKSVRFPVVSAVRWALDNLKEQEEEKNKGEQP